MLQTILYLQGVKKLNKNAQSSIHGGDEHGSSECSSDSACQSGNGHQNGFCVDGACMYIMH